MLLMGKLTISMAIFNSYVSHYQVDRWMVDPVVMKMVSFTYRKSHGNPLGFLLAFEWWCLLFGNSISWPKNDEWTTVKMLDLSDWSCYFYGNGDWAIKHGDLNMNAEWSRKTMSFSSKNCVLAIFNHPKLGVHLRKCRFNQQKFRFLSRKTRIPLNMSFLGHETRGTPSLAVGFLGAKEHGMTKRGHLAPLWIAPFLLAVEVEVCLACTPGGFSAKGFSFMCSFPLGTLLRLGTSRGLMDLDSLQRRGDGFEGAGDSDCLVPSWSFCLTWSHVGLECVHGFAGFL